jgi:hypothetical protein
MESIAKIARRIAWCMHVSCCSSFTGGPAACCSPSCMHVSPRSFYTRNAGGNGQYVPISKKKRPVGGTGFYQLLDQFYIFTSVVSVLYLLLPLCDCAKLHAVSSLTLTLPSPLSSSICRWTKHVSLQWAQQGMRITCRMLLSLSAHKTNTRELHQQAVALFDAARSVGSTENHQIHQQADTRPDEGAWGCRPVGGWPEELATRAQHNDELLCSAHYRGHAGTANVRTQHGPALSITTAGRPRSSASSGIFFKIIRSSPSARPIRHPDMVRDVRPSSISGPPY